MALLYESLHNHTRESDGAQTYLEMLATAEEAGYGAVAFTDHDVLPSAAVMEELRRYQGPVGWTVGVELSSGLPTELGGARKGRMHVLGLFVDVEDVRLREHLAKLLQGRLERVAHMTERFQELGFRVSVEEIMAAAHGAVPGSPHMVKALEAHSENDAVLQRMVAAFRDASSERPELKKAYEEMIRAGRQQYPYRLFMRGSSFYPMPESETIASLVDLDETVSLIREAGGLAVLAHWFTERETITPALLEGLVKDGRIDGLETDVLELQNRPFDVVQGDARFLADLAGRYGRFTCNGIDAHRREDFELWVERQPEAVARSVGQTRRLVERFGVDLRFSRLPD